MSEKLVIYKMFDDSKVPFYASEGAAGMDLYAHHFQSIGTEDNPDRSDLFGFNFGPGERVFVHTGIKMDIPEGHYVAIVPRSGMACKYGITVANAPGTIDCDYKGEIIVCLINHSNKSATIQPDERVAQAILCKYEKAEIVVGEGTGSKETTTRGAGGFGSTGTN